jgi:hypothetical protein
VFFLLQASPDQTKKMEEGADMAMKKLLEDEDNAAAAVSPQKKKKKAKTGKERRQKSEEQKDTEKTEAGSPKKKTKNVAKVQVAVALKVLSLSDESSGAALLLYRCSGADNSAKRSTSNSRKHGAS